MKNSDWKKINLSDIARIYDGTHQTPNYVESGVPFYSVEHVTSGDFDDTKFISEEVFAAESRRVVVEKGDILMTRIGDVGNAKYIDWDVRASFYVSLALLKCKDAVDPRFIAYLINSDTGRREIWAKTLHVAFPNKINLGDIGKCTFETPPKEVQMQIVQVVKVWDEYLENLDQKIELKKKIKKGLMQQLLTGNKRLPGFTSEWITEEIGQLGSTYPGLTGKSKEHFGNGSPYISYMNVYGNYEIDMNSLKLVDVGTEEKQSKATYGDILFTTSSETPYEVGMSSVYLNEGQDEVYLNSFCFGFRLKDFNSLHPKFAKYLFRGVAFRKAMTRIAQGASRYNLSKKYFLTTKIYLPASIQEQLAISDILESCDQEIMILKKMRDRISQQNKYLLNHLVSGQIQIPSTI
ncbi:MAG: restriction endonuclease subunit S, partial [Candidatus Paceibacterota bacterium]